VTITGLLASSDTVYLALHYQNENCHPIGRIPYGLGEDGAAWREAMLAAAKRLVTGLRSAQVPVIHMQAVTEPNQADVVGNCRIFQSFIDHKAWPIGSWGADFIDGLKPEPGDIVVMHGRNNAFYGSRLDEYMARFRPRRLVISGVSTAYVVETTVRHAADAAYEVIVAADACSTFERSRHDASLRAMSLLATIAETDAIVDAVNGKDGGLDGLIRRHWALH
jgi:biuret amidohydrolase